MQFTIRFQTDGDPVDVITTPWVVMLWERRYKTKATRIGTEGLGIEDLAYMAWEAAKCAGVVVPINFDGFAQNVRSIEVMTDDEARPTNAALSVD